MFKVNKIYKITNEDGKVYIGSTGQSLLARFAAHKSAVKANINQCTLKDFNMDTAKMELLEEVEGSRESMLYREKHYMETTECVNKNRPIVTEEEKRIKLIEAAEAWRERLGYNEFICGCGSTIQVREKARHFKTGKHLNFINPEINI
tara:strand:+ start:3726 stop:4169 length:444 start_codon:yes stop_codon:yes gene_type:complete